MEPHGGVIQSEGGERRSDRGVSYLQDVQIIVDIFDILRAELRQVCVLLVHVLHGEQRLRESLAQLLLLRHGHVGGLLWTRGEGICRGLDLDYRMHHLHRSGFSFLGTRWFG